jgi:hypothetical protein
MIAAYSAHRPDSVTAALGIHLTVYCAVGACLAFGLYALLQPTRTPNSGLAAYEPPAGVVLKYGKPALTTTRAAEPIAGVEQPIAPAALTSPEPGVRSTPEPELKPTITAPRSRPRTAKRPYHEITIESPKRRGAACIPGYDSAGAQTRPCG